MTQISSLRGMPDLLPSTAELHTFIITQAQAIASSFGFREIKTPLLEPIEVFKRSVGETSDIVSKEMYTFFDRNEKEICLRPEATASVVRATLNAGLLHQLPQKFFYSGPMFRYERPQKGRLRQFSQMGIEYIGDATPYADLEAISVAWRILTALTSAPLTLELNSLGDEESRALYRTALVEHLSHHQAQLSEESQIRLTKNPLRILDSKEPSDQALLKKAPLLTDFLSPQSKAFQNTLLEGLKTLEIPFTLNPLLVRGLDYYQETAFEFKTSSLGAQNTVLAGGRYDNLSTLLGGPPLPSVGWAAGIDRLALLMDKPLPARQTLLVLALTVDELLPAFQLADHLRDQGFVALVPSTPSLKKGLKHANKLGVKTVILLGPDEVRTKHVIVKDMQKGEQMKVLQTNLDHYLQSVTCP